MPGRSDQRRLKELAAALKAEPGSIPRRLELASALREVNRISDAIDLYRSVAQAYAEEGRLPQAMAVCKGILELDPNHFDTIEMVASLAERPKQRRRATPHHDDADDEAAVTEEPTAGQELPREIYLVADEPSDVRRAMWTPEPLARAPLDFPAETKAYSRHDKLLQPSAPRSAPPILPIGKAHQRVEGELTWDDPPSDAEADRTLIQSAISAPMPRASLVDPPPFPLLSELSRGAFTDLLSRLTVLRLRAGETILREGEVGDACYLISAGTVRVHKDNVELAVLGPGSFFGEFAVLADQRRHASVQAVDAVELLEIRRTLLDELVARHPGVARTLRRFYRERLLQTLMATAPFFSRLTSGERAAVSERFRPRRFGRGARIIEEGSSGGGLFLILVGGVQVVRTVDGGERELGALGEGSYFGEMSLLKGGMASATVRATRLTEVVQLPPRDFYEVVSQHPVLWDHLRAEAERRESANHSIMSGEARNDGTVYLV